jgi:hypothetical protein
MGPIWADLNEELGFTGALGGPEYDKFPEWKRLVADQLLEAGIRYRSDKEKFNSAAGRARQYIAAAQKVVKREWTMIPIGLSMPDMEYLTQDVVLARIQIEILIKLYDAG